MRDSDSVEDAAAAALCPGPGAAAAAHLAHPGGPRHPRHGGRPLLAPVLGGHLPLPPAGAPPRPAALPPLL